MNSTITREATTTMLDVRCAAPTCGTSGQGSLMFQIDSTRTILTISCRKGHLQEVNLAALPLRTWIPIV